MSLASSSGLFIDVFFFFVFVLDPQGFPDVRLPFVQPVEVDGRSGDDSEAEVAKVSLARSLSWSEKPTRFPECLRDRPVKNCVFFHV